MEDHQSKWWASMIKKHGSPEAVREFMQAAYKKGRKNYKGTGGFHANRELAKEMGRKGAEIRWQNANKDNTDTET